MKLPGYREEKKKPRQKNGRSARRNDPFILVFQGEQKVKGSFSPGKKAKKKVNTRPPRTHRPPAPEHRQRPRAEKKGGA